MDRKYHEEYHDEEIGKKVRQTPNVRSRPPKPPSVESIEYQLADSMDRNEFIKDRDRILYSKPFRRLEHKAQIFSHEKGDHFRTRLTHTIEVNQIAKSLCRNLSLNEDLVEAIALGHDIGHTPFGHQGERTLNAIMSGEDTLSGKIGPPLYHGGFKHNYQGVRTLDIIESIYDQQEGLYLTWQTIEGILKHTKIMDADKKLLCHIDCFTHRRKFYFVSGTQQLLHYPHPVTLEGQIVFLADEIAQRQHDLDDALADRTLNISIEGVIESIQETIQNTIDDPTIKVDDLIMDMAMTFSKKLERISNRPNNKQKRRGLVSAIIEYFIIDATYKSMENIMLMVHYPEEKFQFKGSTCYKEKHIELSKLGAKLTDSIEAIINNRIVNSYGVNRFDARAIYIVKQLFKAYYANPKQMPDSVIDRLHAKLQTIRPKLTVRINGKAQDVLATDLRTGEPAHIRLLLDLLRLDIDAKYPFSSKSQRDYMEFAHTLCTPQERIEYMRHGNVGTQKGDVTRLEYDLWRANPLVSGNGNDDQKDANCLCKILVQANHFFMTTICDYIAGMTDNFAEQEFHKLYAIPHN